jgi:hypothetical protein
MREVGDTNRVQCARHNVSTKQTAQKAANGTTDGSPNQALENPATLDGVEVAEKPSYGIKMASKRRKCHRKEQRACELVTSSIVS